MSAGRSTSARVRRVVASTWTARLWRGAFVDLLSLAYSLDGDRGAGFGDHRRNVGLPAFDLPLQVPMNTTGAAQVAAAVRAMHEVALALDEKAGDWFTTADDRAEGNGRIDLARTISPGALAAAIVGRFGVEAPIAKLKLTDAELAAWAESFHGGWCSGDQRLFGLLLDCVLSDLSSAFPMCASLLGWWRFVTAALGEAPRRDRRAAGSLRTGDRRSDRRPQPGCLAPTRVHPRRGSSRWRAMADRGRGRASP